MNHSGQFLKNKISTLLQNSGNLMDGYYLALLSDMALNAITLGRIRPHWRSFISGLMSAEAVVAVESGILFGHLSTPDWGDIPAGLVGASLYVGVSLIGNKIYAELDRRRIALEETNQNVI